MKTYMSYLKCQCGGYFNNKQEDFSFLCNECQELKDFAEQFRRFEEIEHLLLQRDCNIEELCRELESDIAVHDMFYLKIKVFMKYVEHFSVTSNDKTIMENVIRRAKSVLRLTRLLHCNDLLRVSFIHSIL